MKTLLLFLAVGLFATSAWAQDSTNISQHQKKQFQPQPHSKSIVQPKNGEGAVQRGLRLQNPFQMINPFAPAEYGSGGEFIYEDENDPFQRAPAGKPRPKGIKLFGFTF